VFRYVRVSGGEESHQAGYKVPPGGEQVVPAVAEVVGDDALLVGSVVSDRRAVHPGELRVPDGRLGAGEPGVEQLTPGGRGSGRRRSGSRRGGWVEQVGVERDGFVQGHGTWCSWGEGEWGGSEVAGVGVGGCSASGAHWQASHASGFSSE